MSSRGRRALSRGGFKISVACTSTGSTTANDSAATAAATTIGNTFDIVLRFFFRI
jgi:hypothetical protein